MVKKYDVLFLIVFTDKQLWFKKNSRTHLDIFIEKIINYRVVKGWEISSQDIAKIFWRSGCFHVQPIIWQAVVLLKKLGLECEDLNPKLSECWAATAELLE